MEDVDSIVAILVVVSGGRPFVVKLFGAEAGGVVHVTATVVVFADVSRRDPTFAGFTVVRVAFAATGHFKFKFSLNGENSCCFVI